MMLVDTERPDRLFNPHSLSHVYLSIFVTSSLLLPLYQHPQLEKYEERAGSALSILASTCNVLVIT